MPYDNSQMNGRTGKGHHCPICNKPCNHRCEAKGHVVRCRIHPDRFYRPGWSCISCDEADKRTVDEKRKKREQEREREREAKKAEQPPEKRKKDRSQEKMERKRQEAEASAEAIKRGGWVNGIYYEPGEPGEPEC